MLQDEDKRSLCTFGPDSVLFLFLIKYCHSPVGLRTRGEFEDKEKIPFPSRSMHLLLRDLGSLPADGASGERNCNRHSPGLLTKRTEQKSPKVPELMKNCCRRFLISVHVNELTFFSVWVSVNGNSITFLFCSPP